MGYTTGSLADCLPIFQKILSETTQNNMLVQACRLYLENEYIIAAMKALANFTYQVTMPYLNFVEKAIKMICLELFLYCIYTYLLKGKLDILKNYNVDWTHVHMDKQIPSSELDKYLLNKMSVTGAKGVKMQCGREYFPDDERKLWAVQCVHDVWIW